MTTHMINFKKKLEEEKSALTKQLQEVGRVNPDNISDWEPVAAELNISQSEVEERASEITSFEERSAIEYELETKLNEINTALEAIADNSYGFCRVCKSSIEEARLEANPSALTCKAHME